MQEHPDRRRCVAGQIVMRLIERAARSVVLATLEERQHPCLAIIADGHDLCLPGSIQRQYLPAGHGNVARRGPIVRVAPAAVVVLGVMDELHRLLRRLAIAVIWLAAQ